MADKPHLLVVEEITDRMREQLEGSFTLHYASLEDDFDALIADKGDLIEAIVTNGADGTPETLVANLPNLKMISNTGVGYDSTNVALASSRGIVVTHTPDVLNEEVATTALMLLLSVARRLLPSHRWVTSGKWETAGNIEYSRTVDGMKVGIVGLGRIGNAIARKLEAFSCDIAYHTRNERPDSPYRYYGNLVEMARDVTCIIVITPGGPSTHHLITKDVLDALGSDGILVNVARGSVVDEDALVAALQEGRLGHAGLDVFDKEPQVPAVLFDMDQVVLTPHIGSATHETRQAMGDLTTENAVRYFAGEPVLTAVPECADLKKSL
ncbi:2-hydroxyacid dehydrogenase [Alphaproteobacteria bacterium]|jgi:lactate dehydrogenase-like 2-hydroxyacid dehydrogenase|nr:2-hydroxyacid dehydrogenase [Alphaproteobacteria bacterium]MDC0564343.1 2-hydroxyacid dehydrogenase [Alphaproteobacteria bacterium]